MVTNSLCLLPRCIWLHAKCQPLPPTGQPVSSLSVPQPPVQPHYIRLRHRASRLRRPGWHESGRLLLVLERAPKRSPNLGEPSYRDHSLRPVSWGWGGGEQPSCSQESQLHRDADPPKCRWLPWPQLPESGQQHLIPQLPLRRLLLRVQLLLQLRQLAPELSLAVPLCVPQGLHPHPARWWLPLWWLPSPLPLHLPSHKCHRWQLDGSAWLQAQLPLWSEEEVQLQRKWSSTQALPVLPQSLPWTVPADLPSPQHHRGELAAKHQPVHQLSHPGSHQRFDHRWSDWPWGGDPHEGPENKPGAQPHSQPEGGARRRGAESRGALSGRAPLKPPALKEGGLLWRVPGRAATPVLLVQAKTICQVSKGMTAWGTAGTKSVEGEKFFICSRFIKA